MDKLFCDLKTDEEKSAFFLTGRGYETGVISQAIQNDVAMAYHRCVEYKKELEALQSQDREGVKRPVLDSIIDEIHRRADKEWADDGYDFEVTITADEYKALCEEEKVIYHARRIEGDGE